MLGLPYPNTQPSEALPRKYVCVTREALTECDGLSVEEGELECLEEVIDAVVLVREGLHLWHANRAATESQGSVFPRYNALSWHGAGLTRQQSSKDSSVCSRQGLPPPDRLSRKSGGLHIRL